MFDFIAARHFEKTFHRLFKISQGIVDRRALAGDIQLGTKRDEPLVFVVDHGAEGHVLHEKSLTQEPRDTTVI